MPPWLLLWGPWGPVNGASRLGAKPEATTGRRTPNLPPQACGLSHKDQVTAANGSKPDTISGVPAKRDPRLPTVEKSDLEPSARPTASPNRGGPVDVPSATSNHAATANAISSPLGPSVVPFSWMWSHLREGITSRADSGAVVASLPAPSTAYPRSVSLPTSITMPMVFQQCQQAVASAPVGFGNARARTGANVPAISVAMSRVQNPPRIADRLSQSVSSALNGLSVDLSSTPLGEIGEPPALAESTAPTIPSRLDGSAEPVCESDIQRRAQEMLSTTLREVAIPVNRATLPRFDAFDSLTGFPDEIQTMINATLSRLKDEFPNLIETDCQDAINQALRSLGFLGNAGIGVGLGTGAPQTYFNAQIGVNSSAEGGESGLPCTLDSLPHALTEMTRSEAFRGLP